MRAIAIEQLGGAALGEQTRRRGKALAEAMGLDRSTLGRNLRVLEGEGLVALAEGSDLRNRLVMLTEDGVARLAAALPAWEAAQQKLIDQLGADKRETLLALLDELA